MENSELLLLTVAFVSSIANSIVIWLCFERDKMLSRIKALEYRGVRRASTEKLHVRAILELHDKIKAGSPAADR